MDFSVKEKDHILCRVAEAHNQYLEIDLEDSSTNPDKLIIKRLLNLGVLVERSDKGYGNKRRVALSSKGAEMYAKGGFKDARKKEIVEKIWRAIDTIKPW